MKGITTLKMINNVVQDGSYIHDTSKGIITLKIQQTKKKFIAHKHIYIYIYSV